MSSYQFQQNKEKQLAWAIRDHLKLRQRPTGEWEVYTTIHGSDLFRWFIISTEKRNWYIRHFPDIPIVPFEEN